MKLQVTQENLSHALNTVARVANTRNTLPILANVLLKTSNNRLSVSATNLDVAINHYVGAKVSAEGSITVPARLMQDFVASLPSGVINLEVNETKLKLTTEKYNSTINGIVADEFPVMPTIEDGKNWKVNGADFKKALNQTVFAASSDESRPVLTGVVFKSEDSAVNVAATDSYRLAETKIANIKTDIDLLVPSSAMQDVIRILGDYDGEVNITCNDQQVLFTVGDIELTARLLEGKYPDYQKLIPSKFEVNASLARADLLNITKVSSLFAREAAGSVTIKVSADEQKISINSLASQVGENTAEASAEISGSGQITLNSRYLIDALNALDSEKVDFTFNGKLEPVKVSDPKDKNYTQIIMPLKS